MLACHGCSVTTGTRKQLHQSSASTAATGHWSCCPGHTVPRMTGLRQQLQAHSERHGSTLNPKPYKP